MLEKDALLGRSLTVRRLFKQDVDIIMESYKEFDELHFNPVTPVFICKVLLAGEFWGIFDKDRMIACTWLFDAEKTLFQDFDAHWQINDALNKNLQTYLVCGYVWCHPHYQSLGVYQVFSRLWCLQGAKIGKNHLLHYTPVKTWCDLQALFNDEFCLVAMRGLDNLVVHYIFTKTITFQYGLRPPTEKATIVALNNTKEITKLLEQGWFAFQLTEDGKGVYMMKGEEQFGQKSSMEEL